MFVNRLVWTIRRVHSVRRLAFDFQDYHIDDNFILVETFDSISDFSRIPSFFSICMNIRPCNLPVLFLLFLFHALCGIICAVSVPSLTSFCGCACLSGEGDI